METPLKKMKKTAEEEKMPMVEKSMEKSLEGIENRLEARRWVQRLNP